jgi:hypothetical protein
MRTPMNSIRRGMLAAGAALHCDTVWPNVGSG